MFASLHDNIYDANILSEEAGTPVGPSFIGPKGCSNPDRIYLSESMALNMIVAELDLKVAVPQHRALRVPIATQGSRCHVSMPLPALLQTGQQPQHDADLIRQIEHEYGILELENDDPDFLYQEWSKAWEHYLIFLTGQSTIQRGRGQLAPTRQIYSSATRPPCPRNLERLANFVNLLQQLAMGHATMEDWAKTIRTSLPMASRYGVPSLEGLHLQPSNVQREVARVSHRYYQQVLRQEWQHRRHARLLDFREKLHRHGGINKTVSKIIRAGKPVGRLFVDNMEVAGPHHQLREGAAAWKAFSAKAPAPLTQTWQTMFPSLPIRQQVRLPHLDAAALRGRLKRMKVTSSPGRDSWRIHELLALPNEALEGLARLFLRMERKGLTPHSMAATWTALLPPSKPRSSPLDLRPIAVMSVAWRLYAGLRCEHLQHWTATSLPPELYAYKKGLSSLDASVKMGTYFEEVIAAHQVVHAISIDASKAFPSTSRPQLYKILRSKSFPPAVLQVLHSLYERSHTVYRTAGKFVSKDLGFMVRGVYQGCPLSVLAFSAIQSPLVEKLRHFCPTVHCICYADDLTVWSEDPGALKLALQYVESYYAQTNIVLNPSKSQYWCSDETYAEEFQLQQWQIPREDSLTVLGCTYKTKRKEIQRLEAQKVEQVSTSLAALHRLPMSTLCKEKAIEGISHNMLFD